MNWNDLIGRRIGPYEIIEELGRGGSARVYRAYQEGMHRYVAVKALIIDAEDRRGFVRRFEREVEVVAQLSHPNIVAVYDSGQVEDLIYLVMQCITGGTLRQRLGQPMAVGEACRAMTEMAEALHHAHTRGVVHRDVKPSNMLIDAEQDGRLLLTDFGIAKLHGMRGITRSGTTVGTPEYMAPEQAESGDTDARADVYSLGCVLYEALSGRPPFIGTSPVSVLYQQVHARPDYIRGLNPRVPRELARVIEIALAKRPDERFTTAEAFALALRPYADARGHPTGGVALPAPISPLSTAILPPQADGIRGSEESAQGDRGAELPVRLPQPYGAEMDAGVTQPLNNQDGAARDREPPEHDPDAAGGLGLEGLDALFPDDADSVAGNGQQPAPASSGAPAYEGRDLLPATEPSPWANLPPPDAFAAPPRSATGTSWPHPTIPLPAFRLPSRDTTTRPLDLPLTPEGQLDIEALMSQVEQPSGIPLPLPPPAYSDWDGGADPAGYDRRTLGGRPRRSITRDHTPAELHAALSGPLRDTPTAPPVWRPAPEARAKPHARLVSRLLAWLRSRRILAALALVAFLAVALIASAILVTSGGPTTRREPPPAPTATVVPTATTIPSATATATPTRQAILDQQARAAFQAITLATSYDSGCGSANNRSSFGAGVSIYVNLCVAHSAPDGQVTITLRQNGTTIRPLARDTAVYPGYWYGFFSNGLQPGTYDMLVTFNGGTAADLTFTVS